MAQSASVGVVMGREGVMIPPYLRESDGFPGALKSAFYG